MKYNFDQRHFYMILIEALKKGARVGDISHNNGVFKVQTRYGELGFLSGVIYKFDEYWQVINDVPKIIKRVGAGVMMG